MPTAEVLQKSCRRSPAARAATRLRVVRSRLSMISFFRASVQRLKIEAPARLMIQSCSGTAAIQGPSWLGSPVRKLMPAWGGAGGWARRLRMVMAWPAWASSRDR